MSKSPSEITKEAADIIDERGWTGLIRDRGFGGIFWTAVLSIIGFILAIGDGIQQFIGTLRDGMIGMVGGTFGGVVNIMAAGQETAVYSFTHGMASMLGPFAWPAGVFIGLAGVWVAYKMYERIDFSPTVFVTDRFGR